jgi:hypothetical protein
VQRNRILRDVQNVLEARFYSSSTTGVEHDSGNVTVTITRADGTVLQAATPATDIDPDLGVYRYTLAPQTNLDHLTARWSGLFGGATQAVTNYWDIVGGFYVSLAELRALPELSNTTTFPDETLRGLRDAFEVLAENHCQTAFTPQYAHEWGWGDSSQVMYVDKTPVRRLLSVKVDDVAATFSGWTVEERGKITRDTGTFPIGQRVEWSYEYGEDAPDAELRLAALKCISRFVLGQRSGIPDNALTMTTAEGGFTLGIAGADRPTGDPFVDGVLDRRKRQSPAAIPLVM